jgi:hypothetical protein
MNKILIPIAAFLLAACSSEPVKQPAEHNVQPSTSASQAGPDETKDEPSQVLNKSKKCPKKTKLVNGKCLMDVETSE